MTNPMWFSRRLFLYSAGMTAIAARAGLLQAADMRLSQPMVALSDISPRYAFVSATGSTHGIHVYAINTLPWQLQHFVASQSPVSMVLHPTGRWLYVLNGISEYNGLPHGSVESYEIDFRSGQLTLLGRQMLSLSATLPRHLTIAPHGKSLVVSVHGGGLYNLVPILENGRLGRVNGILKETGSGPHAQQESAHPQATIFDSTGKRAITSDLGCDRISVLSVEDGLRVLTRFDLPAGSGPRHLALHPSGHLLYVANALDGTLSGFAYDTNKGNIRSPLLQLHREYPEALTMDPVGGFLYTARSGTVTAWEIEIDTGGLRRVWEQRMTTGDRKEWPIDSVLELVPAADGRRLFIVSVKGVYTMEVDPDSGRLSFSAFVASVTGAQCLVFQALSAEKLNTAAIPTAAALN